MSYQRTIIVIIIIVIITIIIIITFVIAVLHWVTIARQPILTDSQSANQLDLLRLTKP